MQFKKLFQSFVMAALVLGTTSTFAWAQDTDSPGQGRAGALGISGDAGYYTYGMSDVNNRLNGGSGDLHGGLGYGAAVKLCLTNRLAAKVGVDYLFASAPSSKTLINNTTVESQVNLPATMIFIGGEYAFLQLPALNVKLIAGYTLVNIFNGVETSSNSLDLGSISGTGSGAQVGAGVEFFLGRAFSVEADLAYNLARINGATFAGSPEVPPSSSVIGAVDYSGLVAKVAFTIYLIP